MGIKNYTHPYREWNQCDSVYLRISDYVTLSMINGSNISAGFHAFEPKIMSQIFFSAKGWLARGQKNSDLSSYLRYFTRCWSEN